MDELELLERELRDRRVHGPVLFDLLLVNGNTDRYYLASFDGQHFSPYRMTNVDSRKAEFRRMSAAVYKETAAQVNTALLSPALRLAVSHGIPV
ncbi:type II toxin-antitoxin system RnlB family antitoxin [Cupriavidus sp. IK-TO18]|nr:type II toxin-antitoxin system RnlB family antitoxin [Cupriavidus sp. IK-TO18]